MRCWEAEDRCEDCPRDHPGNECSEYLKERKPKKKVVDEPIDLS